jgi:hypothetical protein
MEVQIKHKPAYSMAVVTLASNEQVKVEPGAMGTGGALLFWFRLVMKSVS